MRRAELERLGIQLPVLPTIVLGGLPGPPDWAARLDRLGLDVVSSGAVADTPETWAAARAAAPLRAVKAVAGDPVALAAAGCAVIEADIEVDIEGTYHLGPQESLVAAVAGDDPAVEDADDVAADVVLALGAAPPALLWVTAGPGLEGHPPDVAEAKLAALVEGVRRARLLLAKEQFERE